MGSRNNLDKKNQSLSIWIPRDWLYSAASCVVALIRDSSFNNNLKNIHTSLVLSAANNVWPLHGSVLWIFMNRRFPLPYKKSYKYNTHSDWKQKQQPMLTSSEQQYQLAQNQQEKLYLTRMWAHANFVGEQHHQTQQEQLTTQPQ